MIRSLSKKHLFLNKRGSYVIEAALTLPVFVIAVIIMSSVILMYACIEDCSFIAANEMRRGAAEAAFTETSVMIPYRIRREVLSDHSRVRSASLEDFGYRTSRWGKDELIVCKLRLELGSGRKIGIEPRAHYDLSLVTRAYVGIIRDVSPMSESEFEGNDCEPVFIFPSRGERYHSAGCSFLTAASSRTALTPAMKRKYSSCPLCRSRQASIGTRVYYFPSAGEDYHLGSCPSLERNYIEIDRKDAVSRGYTPCSKCGG